MDRFTVSRQSRQTFTGLMRSLTKRMFIIFLGLSSVGYTIPGTDISLFRILNNDSGIQLQFETNLIKHPGYDNQPAFNQTSELLLFTRMQGSQTDIWQVNLSDGKLSQVTDTQESEYSPTPLAPSVFSSVIAFNGRQTLWRIEHGKHQQKLSGSVEPVGYHTWISDHGLALFRLGEPNELVLLRKGAHGQQAQVIARDIGRSLAADPKHNRLFYVQNIPEGSWLTEYPLSTGKAKPLIRLFAGQQDFAFHPELGFFHSDGRSIYLADFSSLSWQRLKIRNQAVIHSITRLAVSPNHQWLAVVHADLSD
jgi:hypothetical protein